MALSSILEPTVSYAGEWLEAPARTDIGLIDLSQTGDVEAFNLLVERYQHRVYGLCFQMVGEFDAADVTQEVFLSAFRSIRQYRGGSLSAGCCASPRIDVVTSCGYANAGCSSRSTLMPATGAQHGSK